MAMKEYRCSLTDCRALLFKGEFIGTVERVCKCGALNRFTVEAPKPKPDSQNGVPYQDRMKLIKK